MYDGCSASFPEYHYCVTVPIANSAATAAVEFGRLLSCCNVTQFVSEKPCMCEHTTTETTLQNTSRRQCANRSEDT